MRHPYFDLPGPVVLGHRGAAGVAPENTLPSFARALQQGAHILESDVHGTCDGVPVLLHDADVDRTTDGSGPVAEMTLSQLHELDAGHSFSPADAEGFPFRGQGLVVPTLREAFEAFPHARFNLEIKAESPQLIRTIVAAVREAGREKTTLLTAGEDPIMGLLRSELAGDVAGPALGASLGDILGVVRAALAGEAPQTDSMALQIPHEFSGRPLVSRQLVEHCHAHDIAVHVWTINDPDEMRELLDLDVDGIVTDFPGRAVELLARRSA